jgi:hypothetical protein
MPKNTDRSVGWTRLLVAFLIAVPGPNNATARAAEQAKAADSFVDSIGINTHYGNAIYVGGNAYANPLIDEKLAALGIRHLRDHTWNDTGLARIDGLYSDFGIRTSLILGETSRSPAELQQLVKQHPAYEAIEGLNEPDFNPRSYNGLIDNPATNSYLATRAFQNDLFAAINGDSQTAGVAIFSPAMGNSARAQYLAGTGFDYASMHSYPNGRLPTNLLDTKIADTNKINDTAPAAPIMATETGYYNRPADGGQVSELAMSKYLPRLFAEYFNRGIARTYSYELADQGSDATEREQNFGLLRFDMTEKPAYTALKNMIGLLEEPAAPNFTPGTLNYTLVSTPLLAHHTLLQKSNGTFYLLLWNEVSVWNLTSQRDVTNVDLSATLAFGDQFALARVYLPNVSASPVAMYSNPTTLNLSVPDRMMVVELVPIPEPRAFVLFLSGLFAAILAAKPPRRHHP